MQKNKYEKSQMSLNSFNSINQTSLENKGSNKLISKANNTNELFK